MTATPVLPTLLKTLSLSGLAVAIATSAFLYVGSDGDSSSALAASTAAEGSTTKLATAAAPPAGAVEFEMDWPNHGTDYLPQPGDMIRGYASAPGITIQIEALNPATHLWETFSTATAAVVEANVPTLATSAYAWAAPATVPGFWSTAQFQGGALRLRARPVLASGTALNTYDFDVDGPLCLANIYAQAPYSRNAEWVSAANACRSPFPIPLVSIGAGSSGATVLSTQTVPFDLGRPFISMVTPTSNPLDPADPANDQIGTAYYAATGVPTSLVAFKSLYGFQTNETAPYTNGEIEATYYNRGDLGIGRNMHCRRFAIAAGSGLACYVKNFADDKFNPTFGGDESGYLTAAIQKNPDAHFATVAMVQFDNSSRVDFVAYAFEKIVRPPPRPPLIVNKLATTARLDNGGTNVAVPTNCLSCHGGTYSGTTAAGSYALGARFLPFDSDSRILTFATGSLATSFPGYTQAAQASNIRALNELIYNFAQTSPGVKKHIATMYGNENATSVGASYTQDYIPSNWSTTAASTKLYKEVVKPYCIGCHVSFPNPARPANDDLFASYSNFVAYGDSVLNYVCNHHNYSYFNTHRMPAAEQTNINFWKSPARAYLLNHLGDGTESCNP